VTADLNSDREVIYKTYAVNEWTALAAADAFMRWNEAVDVAKNEETRTITAIVGRDSALSRAGQTGLWGPIGAFTINYGSYVGIRVVSIGVNECRVGVTSQNTAIGWPQTGPRVEDVHAQLAKILDLMASGKPLPDAPPADIVSQKN
jgi:hypothetical protein